MRVAVWVAMRIAMAMRLSKRTPNSKGHGNTRRAERHDDVFS